MGAPRAPPVAPVISASLCPCAIAAGGGAIKGATAAPARAGSACDASASAVVVRRVGEGGRAPVVAVLVARAQADDSCVAPKGRPGVPRSTPSSGGVPPGLAGVAGAVLRFEADRITSGLGTGPEEQ